MATGVELGLAGHVEPAHAAIDPGHRQHAVEGALAGRAGDPGTEPG